MNTFLPCAASLAMLACMASFGEANAGQCQTGGGVTGLAGSFDTGLAGSYALADSNGDVPGGAARLRVSVPNGDKLYETYDYGAIHKECYIHFVTSNLTPGQPGAPVNIGFEEEICTKSNDPLQPIYAPLGVTISQCSDTMLQKFYQGALNSQTDTWIRNS